MTTARRLIYDGFREGNIIPPNTLLSATDEQNTEALPLLNNFLFDLVGEVIGEEPQDWPVPAARTATTTPYWNIDPNERSVEQQPASGVLGSSDQTFQYPPPNARLIIKATAENLTVYLPPAPDDGALMQIADLNSTAVVTLDANGRFINDQPTLVLDPVSSYNGKTYMYRADKATWYEITDMLIDDVSPLPTVFDDVLSIGLYFRIAPRFGSTPSPATAAMYKRKLQKLKNRYRQSQPVSAPAKSPTNSTQEYRGGRAFGLE